MLVGRFIGFFIGAFNKNPDGGVATEEVVFDKLADGRVDDFLKVWAGSRKNDGLGIFPVVGRVEKEGGIFRDSFQSDNRELFGSSERVEIEGFEFKVEVFGD